MNLLDEDLPAGNIQLLDWVEPPLQDGLYYITVTQSISATGASVPEVRQQFIVAGPRFTIDASEVSTEFPPDGSSSQFANVLPHVVLAKRLLPWERDIPGLESTAPWIALLIFEEGELTDAGCGLQTMTVDALLNSQAATVRVPKLAGVTADELASSCSVITMNSATFAALAPTGRELPYLAHARVVDMSAKAIPTMPDQGMFSVVVANRFPLPGDAVSGAKCMAHLVSMEGFGDLLGGTAPAAPPQAQVMMVSLYSWTFSCLADPSQTFAGLAQNLACSDGDGTPRPAASLLLRLPYADVSGTDAATTLARQRLDSGYVPLGYHAQSGEDGFAWYRGPFSPVVPNAVAGVGEFVGASAAMIYDPAYGVFDHSLAAAWQCGQTLALSDQTYATTLMRLRQNANAQLDRMAAHGTSSPQTRQQAVHDRFAALVDTGVLDRVGEASHEGGARRTRVRREGREPSASLRELRQALARPQTRAALGDPLPDDPDAIEVANWLGQLQLLYWIPFVHLAPNAGMLPQESIRFFYVDANWVSALTAGALNIGLGSSKALAVQGALTGTLEEMAAGVARSWRANALGVPVPAAAAGPLSGFLIRSALVSSWPGLTVRATAAAVPVDLLRLDQVAPGVMLGLFNGVPDQLVLEQPHEGLEFGVDDTGNSQIRAVDGAAIDTKVGPLVYDATNPARVLPTIRSGGMRVLNLNVDASYPSASPPATPVDLLGTLAQGLGEGTASMGPALFALQMIAGPGRIRLSLQPTLTVASGEVAR